MWGIEFYETARGECPFQAFLDSSDAKVQAKFIKLLDLLEEHGPNLKRPYADILRDGIRELRARHGTKRYRALFFFFIGQTIVITHGIIKKTDGVPPAEIDRALRCRADFLQRRTARRARP